MAQEMKNIQSYFHKRKKPHSLLASKAVVSARDAKNNKKTKLSPTVFADLHRGEEEDEFEDDVETVLRQFDMDVSFGPCLGLSRLERWERAAAFGLNPSPHVKQILERAGASPVCLWEGRV